MAGDWIKIEHGLLNKPEVMLLADALDVSHFEAVGHLVAFWLWVDLNLSPSCPQVKGTKKGLDRVAGRDGFADALVSVGWLKIEDDLISIPGYEVHLSKSAKERAKEQKKKASQRSKASPKLSPTTGDKIGTEQGTREEKRREEDNPPLPPKGNGGDVPKKPEQPEDPPPSKPKRKPKETIGEFDVPPRLDTPEIRQALADFETMRLRTGKRIKDRGNLCRGWDRRFVDAAHLLACIECAISNEYQGISPDYVTAAQSAPVAKPSIWDRVKKY